jgi:hypothetical protein
MVKYVINNFLQAKYYGFKGSKVFRFKDPCFAFQAAQGRQGSAQSLAAASS